MIQKQTMQTHSGFARINTTSNATQASTTFKEGIMNQLYTSFIRSAVLLLALLYLTPSSTYGACEALVYIYESKSRSNMRDGHLKEYWSNKTVGTVVEVPELQHGTVGKTVNWNDDITSYRLSEANNEDCTGLKLVLYEHYNFLGESLELTWPQNTGGNLEQFGWNNRASSFKVFFPMHQGNGWINQPLEKGLDISVAPDGSVYYVGDNTGV